MVCVSVNLSSSPKKAATADTIFSLVAFISWPKGVSTVFVRRLPMSEKILGLNSCEIIWAQGHKKQPANALGNIPNSGERHARTLCTLDDLC